MPDYVELLRAKAQVRAAGPRTLPMPRGTMRLPAQTSAAQASYSAEDRRIPVSQPGTGALVASYKKEVGLVPISNDLMRFADPAIDAFVRDDLVKVMALREDLAFLIGDGTQDSPRGFLSFANAYAVARGGTPGNWLHDRQFDARRRRQLHHVERGLHAGDRRDRDRRRGEQARRRQCS